MGSALSVKNYESMADRRLAGGFLADTNYSGTLAPINWSRYFIFINNLLIYKSVQQQVLKLFFHDTINIQIRGLNLVKFINTLLLLYIIILF